MFSKRQNVPKHNPWGDDHPEKLSNKPRTTATFGDQLKGLTSPESWINHVLGIEKTKEEVKPHRVEKKPGIPKENVVFSFSKKETRQERQLHQETQQVLSVLKEQITVLQKSEKGLSHELSKVKVEQLPQKTGIYYLRYLEWLLNIVKQLRMRVDEGRSWLKVFSQRKKKRMAYWQMYKKHGTTFGLSHERALATQAG